MEMFILWLQVWQLGAAKSSVVMFYRRVFITGGTERFRRFKYSTLFLLVLIGAWTLAFFFNMLFACGTNFAGNWTTVEALVKECHGSQLGQMAYAICDFATDIFIITQPLPMVWKLHMARRRKCMVSGAFLLGALAVAASGLRMAIYILVDTSFINPKQDGGWTVDLFLFWSVVESGLAILAACLPSLLFLWQKLDIIANSAPNSVRSTFSLQSLHSRHPDQHDTVDSRTKRTDSADTQTHLGGPEEAVVQSYITGKEMKDRMTVPPRWGSQSLHLSRNKTKWFDTEREPKGERVDSCQ